MILTYKGVSSSPHPLPGCSPQGAFLGIFLFIVKFNGAALRPYIPRITFHCRLTIDKCKDDNCPDHLKTTHALYVDDLSELEAFNLKECLKPDSSGRPYPLNFHERTGHILKQKSLLQGKLEAIENFTIENQMKVNQDKTKVMIFNRSKLYDFAPEFHFGSGSFLECLEECKLLGVTITSNLKWDSNTHAIYRRAMGRMWLLRRMKHVKVDKQIILDYYTKEIRPLAEHGVPVWNSGLTQYQIKELEKIQKVALHIIYGRHDIPYLEQCDLVGLSTLEDRRHQLCTNFAIKLFKSSRKEEYFTLNNHTLNTRSQKGLVKENLTRTSSAFNAPHNYLSRLVNINAQKLR